MAKIHIVGIVLVIIIKSKYENFTLQKSNFREVNELCGSFIARKMLTLKCLKDEMMMK